MKSSIFYSISWSMYLCCSWMWCIGLFYPVLLHRDFGSSSWCLFIIPNIIGATLVPWFIKDLRASEKFINRHSIACRIFSFVTIVFQFYFIVWLFLSFEPLLITIFITIFIFLILGVVLLRSLLLASAVSFLFSLIALGFIFYFNQDLSFKIPRENADLSEGIGLLPVFLIGFFFCPYLDLTFHRVIRETNNSNTKIIYLISFCIFFLLLLFLGRGYYSIAYNSLLGEQKLNLYNAERLIFYLYFTLQLSFTFIVHIQELFKQKSPQSLWLALIIVLISLIILVVFSKGQLTLFGKLRHLKEIFYISILSFYGLVVPLYMWIFVVISRYEYKVSKVFYPQKVVFFIILLAVLPLYAVGFLGKLKMIPYVLPIAVLFVITGKFIILRLLILTNKLFKF